MIDPEDINSRFRYYPAKDEETKRYHETIRESCTELAHYVNGTVPDGREKSLAITKIEEAMMWANAGIARES